MVNKTKGYVFLVHGLNNRTSIFDSWIEILGRQNLTPQVLSLSGHDDSTPEVMEEFKVVTAEKWLNEVREAVLQIKEKANKEGVPFYLMGYSLGALLTEVFMASLSEPIFDKAVLFAPGLNIRKRSLFIKALGVFRKSLMLPSFSPEKYQVHSSTPMQAYQAVFDLNRKWKSFSESLPLSNAVNIPTLVLLDRRDEFVDLKKTGSMIEDWGLTNWELFRVWTKGRSLRKRTYRHLSLVEDSFDPQEWARVQAAVVKHFS